MAAYELLLLNTAIPQIQAAQSGDTYVVPRDIAFSTVANLANGTNLLPSLTFSSDTNTGIYREGADALGFTAGGGTNQMVLTTTGLGLGTSSPGYKLDVAGKISYNGAIGEGTDNTLSSSGTTLILGESATWTILQLRTGGTERMRLDSSGNLGLGVTPSAWGSNYRVLDIVQFGTRTASLVGGSGQTGIGLALGVYHNNTNWIATVSSAPVGRYEIDGVGNHSFFTYNGTVTAGNAISFTQAMTLDASGNLVVGATSTSYRMEVVAPSGDNVTALFRSGDATAANNAGGGFRSISSATAASRVAQVWLDADGANLSGGDYFYIQKNGNSGTADIVQYSNSAMTFATNAAERARITSGGYFKASNSGTYQNSAAAYHELRQSASDWIAYVVNSNAAPFGINIGHITDANSTGSPFLACNAGAALGTLRAEIRSDGGLANYSANNVNLASDRRLKNTIEPMRSYYDVFKNLSWVTWLYNDQTDDLKNHGVIAQELQGLAPELVCESNAKETPEGETPYLGIWEQDFKMAGMSVITELIKKIEKLEAEVAALKGA